MERKLGYRMYTLYAFCGAIFLLESRLFLIYVFVLILHGEKSFRAVI